MLLLVAVLLTLLTTRSLSTRTASIASGTVTLHPEIPLPSQHVLYGVPQFFLVVELDRDKVYDIKVSYPATQPSLFTLQVEHVVLPLVVQRKDEDARARRDPFVMEETSDAMPHRNRRLNTAKLRLHPMEVQSHASVRYRLAPAGDAVEVVFSLVATVEGVQRPDSTLATHECVFDIVVEEMLLEAFPKNTVLLIGWVLLLLVVSGRCVLPYLEKKMALACKEDRVKATETKES
ncbi:unnamed protein product [Hyaloperonospora brassicae]|uniref:ER membrane protein complex subunit 7 beta-sandwich domain-containing protein n=1 Tax=Hyaloperonospora brassicae TaxID=162125 RepID=A0AAV0TUW1_HYABA|nr:unnamed protein product [Hyaloperonospora brassicae]